MMIIVYIIVGFLAQMIDGTLGMAYGVSCRTFLKTFTKVPSQVVSALVHYAEIPSTFFSMIYHMKYKNIDKTIFLNLLIPGIIGSVIGAYIVTMNFNIFELLIDIYLVLMGVIVFTKGFDRKTNIKERINNKHIIRLLGLLGSFFDASGGGGWGPIVTGSLMINTKEPKKIIGTVNSSEFFVTLSSSITFIILIANIKEYIPIVIGLVIGGIIASKLAVNLCMKISNRKLYFATGLLLILLNIYNIVTFF